MIGKVKKVNMNKLNKSSKLNKKLNKRRGFTLIELMIVLVVLGTLMTILFVSIGDIDIDEQTANLKMKSAKFQLEAAIFKFQNHFGRPPAEDEGLKVLIEPSPETESNYPPTPFIRKKEMLIDPWGNPYQYRIDSETGKYMILSFGSDKQEGGEGPAKDRNLADIR